ALANHESLETAARTARLVQAVELASLVEERRLGRVEVLRLARVDDASAEGDHAAARIANREHHAVAEAVVVTLTLPAGAAFAFDDETGVDEALALGIAAAETTQHLVPRVGGVADREALAGRGRETALRQVLARARLAPELLRVEARNARQQFVQRLIRARRGTIDAALVRHLESEAHGELLDGLGEGHVIVIHEKAERSAVLAAAEAVIELFVRAHPEGRGFLGVERTAGLVLAA